MHPSLRSLPILIVLVLSTFMQTSRAQPAPATRPVETTPTSLPGAEAHVFRELKPDPLRLFVFKPDGWKPDDQRSALVFFFGGGWNRGTAAKFAPMAQLAAQWRMVGIVPDYRTRGRFKTTAKEAVADARASVRWVQEHADELGIDPERVVVGGSSAGGHLALWTAIAKAPVGSDEAESPLHKPAALVLFVAPTDTSLPGLARRMGGDAVALSPLHHLDPAAMPPTLMFHGDADTTVPYAQAVALHEKLSAAGIPCDLVTIPGGTHGFTNQFPEWKDKTRAMMRAFLDKQDLIPAQ